MRTLVQTFTVWYFCFAILLGTANTFADVKTSTDHVNQLMALPYLQGYFKAPEKVNVTRYNRALTDVGDRLYTSGDSAQATLIDIKGHVLHQWTDKKATPHLISPGGLPFWENVYLFPNGDLLAIYHNGNIIKLDKNSEQLWSFPTQAHHDIDVDDKENIYTLTNEKIQLKKDAPILDNTILVLSPQGKLIKKIFFVELLHKSKHPNAEMLLKRVVGMAFAGNEDVFHSNTLQVLDGTLADRFPEVFKKGNLLVSMLTLSTLMIIDPQREEIVWILGPRLWQEGQHNATLIDNGHMLTFDNHFSGGRTHSRVIEFDPIKKDVIWEYRDDNFYTDTHGSQQRLTNGNTLIVEANKGRAFEVTTNKEIVWEFINPNKTGPANDLIATLLAMYRIDPAYTSSWLKRKF